MIPAHEIKRLQQLRDNERARRDADVFIVEGDKSVREFLQTGRFHGELFATPAWEGWGRASDSAPPPCKVIAVTEADMTRISHFPSPSSVLAVFQRPENGTLGPDQLNHGYTLALDAVQDPGNVGTIIRIADWYGIPRLLLGAGCADPFSQKVVNASKGSLARAQIHRLELAPVLAAAQVPILGCDLDGMNLHTMAPPAAAVIVIGSEGRGLSESVRPTITQRVTIPAFGQAESLNAGVAAAIVCDNLRRQMPG